MTTLTIEKVIQGRATKGGHAIEIEWKDSNGAQHIIECPLERAGMFVHAIHNAAVVAERMLRTAPGQAFSLEVPYRANDVRTGTSTDSQYLLLQFSTAEGFPVGIAMAPEIGRRTTELLSNELSQLGRQPPLRRS